MFEPLADGQKIASRRFLARRARNDNGKQACKDHEP